MSDAPRASEEWRRLQRDETGRYSSDVTYGDLAHGMSAFAKQLERQLAETTKDRDEWKERYERLNESLAKNKRLFSTQLAERIISEQVARIKFLEDQYSKLQKELCELKSNL